MWRSSKRTLAEGHDAERVLVGISASGVLSSDWLQTNVEMFKIERQRGEFAPGDVVEMALQTEASVLMSWIGAPGVTDCNSRASPSGRHASSPQSDACVAAPGNEGLDAGFAGP